MIYFCILFIQTDTPSITAKLINEQKEDKEKKNHEEKEKMKADNGFQDNYSVVVASGTYIFSLHSIFMSSGCIVVIKKANLLDNLHLRASSTEKKIVGIVNLKLINHLKECWRNPFLTVSVDCYY